MEFLFTEQGQPWKSWFLVGEWRNPESSVNLKMPIPYSDVTSRRLQVPGARQEASCWKWSLKIIWMEFTFIISFKITTPYGVSVILEMRGLRQRKARSLLHGHTVTKWSPGQAGAKDQICPAQLGKRRASHWWKASGKVQVKSDSGDRAVDQTWSIKMQAYLLYTPVSGELVLQMLKDSKFCWPNSVAGPSMLDKLGLGRSCCVTAHWESPLAVGAL